MLLMLPLATAAAVTPIATAVVVELLVMWASAGAVLVAVAALVAVVAVLAMFAMLPRGTLVVLSVFAGRALLLLSRLARRFGRGGRWRWRRRRGRVLGRY
jgi:hypothetical protein